MKSRSVFKMKRNFMKHELWFARASGQNYIKRFVFLQWRAYDYMLHKKMVACAARGTRSDYQGRRRIPLLQVWFARMQQN
mmetsp:Transcript_48223/g.119442  ORF Transcript_48223/g.119442 Transcript_48223/m.119442 type:complete len:80 (+) Transcript_48223:112-351(+)